HFRDAQFLQHGLVMIQIGVHAAKARMVAGWPEARMVGQDHLVSVGPLPGEIDAMEGAAAMEEQEGRAVAAGMEHDLHAVDHGIMAGEALGRGLAPVWYSGHGSSFCCALDKMASARRRTGASAKPSSTRSAPCSPEARMRRAH